jgi:diguanylate cyclase (GGDEF)-like protein/PAS domain S-box-containing protein
VGASARADTRESHIERLVDAIDLPIGRWDSDARLTFVNSPYVAWACRSRDELLGKTLAEIYGESAWDRARNAFAEAFEGRTVFYERQLMHRPGGPRWARVQVFPDIDPRGEVVAVYTIAFDIHADVVEREELVAARKRLDRFTENIPYPLSYVDRDCAVRFVNKAYAHAVAMPPLQIIGRHVREVRGERLWNEHEPYFLRALAGESVQYTRLLDFPAFGPRWMRTSYVPDFGEDGSVAGLYTVTMDVHELTTTQEKLRRSVERDAVTDVLSRRAMMERIEQAVQSDSSVALFFIDLDGFKAVNDALGHREGDQLLVDVATALQGAVRAEDAVGRFGGDEFVVLAHVRDQPGAQALALHLLAAIRGCNRSPQAGHAGVGAGVSTDISASIGYALAPEDAQNAMKLLQRADDAMYDAKRRGKDQVCHCSGRGDAALIRP